MQWGGGKIIEWGPLMSRTRNLLLASAALCAIASTALAADLPTKKGPPPAPAPAPFSWTGFDVGLQGGYGWGVESDDLSTTEFGVSADHFSANGPFGGAHVGYNQQIGSLVIGLYGELDGFDLHGTRTASSTTAIYQPNCVEGCTVTEASIGFQNTWQAFLLARAGVAFDRWLVYLTGGLAVGDDRENVSVTETYYQGGDPAWAGSQTNTLTGGAVGLGVEYAFDAHWRFGAEWRYVDFPKTSYLVMGPNNVPYKAGFSENLALVSLSYGF
jgi:outer membrane immunogenic protein